MQSLEFYGDRLFQCQKCGTMVKYGEQMRLLKINLDKLGLCPSCEEKMTMAIDDTMIVPATVKKTAECYRCIEKKAEKFEVY